MSEPARTLGLGDSETPLLSVAAGGILAFALGWILDSRLLRVLGLVAAAVGGGLYARGKLTQRGEKIAAAESSIRSTLDDLDPVARAQVVADLARSSSDDE